MDAKSEQEQPQQRFIKLINPNDLININKTTTPDSFQSQEKLIPSLGYVTLFGDKLGVGEFDDSNAIFIEGDKVIKGKEEELAQRIEDLYDFGVRIGATQKTSPEIMCKMRLGNLLELEGNLIFDIDEVAIDPKERFKSLVYIWNDKDGKEYHFYVPADSKFLSQIEFAFYTDLSADMEDLNS